MMLMTPPSVRPVSAVYMFVCTRTSAIASIDGLIATVPIVRSLLSMPSTSWLFSTSLTPLMDTDEVWRRSSGRVPLASELSAPSFAPGMSCTMRMMFRPGIGASCTVFVSMSELTVAESVCSSGASPLTVRFSCTVPSSIFASTRARSPVARSTLCVDRLKTLELDLHRVRADRKEREYVVTRIGADGRAYALRGDVLCSYCDRREDGAAGVGDAADDVSGALRECDGTDREDDEESAAQRSKRDHTCLLEIRGPMDC